MSEQLIDVSQLEPPEPMERIMDALADLPESAWLRVRHRRDPVPLYRLLRNMGYAWDTRCVNPGQYEILIWPQDMQPPGGVGAEAN